MSSQVDKKPKPPDNTKPDHQDVVNAIVFQTIKEDRDTYFVEYFPAQAGNPSASLALVFPDHVEPLEAAKLMEQECGMWLQRYPVPLMVTAFDETDSIIKLTGKRDCDHLIGILEKGSPTYHWKLLKNDEFPEGPLQESHLVNIYNDLSYSTGSERQERASKHAKSIRLGILIITMWGLVVPVAVFVIGLIGLSYPLLSIAIIVYSFGKAIIRTLKMTGHFPKSEREKQKEAEDMKMRHHHYHCEQNPDGFLRLKMENFEREARENIQKEAEKIKNGLAKQRKNSE